MCCVCWNCTDHFGPPIGNTRRWSFRCCCWSDGWVFTALSKSKNRCFIDTPDIFQNFFRLCVDCPRNLVWPPTFKWGLGHISYCWSRLLGACRRFHYRLRSMCSFVPKVRWQLLLGIESISSASPQSGIPLFKFTYS